MVAFAVGVRATGEKTARLPDLSWTEKHDVSVGREWRRLWGDGRRGKYQS